MTKKVTITGYYGCGNLGDEALCEVAVSALREAGVEPLLLTGKDRFRLRRIVRCLRAGAALILGGGGLLQNRTSIRSLYYYLGLIVLARVLRRPAFLVGQGIGPITGSLAWSLTRFVLSRVSYLGVRDGMSRAVAHSLGLPAHLDGDLFFLNPPLPETWPRNDRPRIGISLSGGSVEGRIESWVLLLAALPAAHEIVFIPFFPHEDLEMAKKLAGRLPSAAVHVPSSAAEAQGLIRKFDLIISSRLHPLEFALRAGTPMIAVPHDPKVAAFTAEVAECGGPEIPCTEHPRVEEISTLLRNPPPKERFAAAYAALHQRTQAGFDRFLNALSEMIGGKNG